MSGCTRTAAKRFSSIAPGSLDTGFAASALLRRRSVIRDVAQGERAASGETAEAVLHVGTQAVDVRGDEGGDRQRRVTHKGREVHRECEA